MARSTTGVGDTGVPVTVSQGDRQVAGRLLRDGNGTETVVTAAGNFQKTENGQWAPAPGTTHPSESSNPQSSEAQNVTASAATPITNGLRDVMGRMTTSPQAPGENSQLSQLANGTNNGGGSSTPAEQQAQLERLIATGQQSTHPQPGTLAVLQNSAPTAHEGTQAEVKQVIKTVTSNGNGENFQAPLTTNGGRPLGPSQAELRPLGTHETGQMSNLPVHQNQQLVENKILTDQLPTGRRPAEPGPPLLNNNIPFRPPTLDNGQAPTGRPPESIENRLKRLTDESPRPPVVDNRILPPVLDPSHGPPVRLDRAEPALPVAPRPPELTSPPPISGRPPDSPLPVVRPDRPQDPTPPVVRVDRPIETLGPPNRLDRPQEPSVQGRDPARPDRITTPTGSLPDQTGPTTIRRDRLADQPPPPLTGAERRPENPLTASERRPDLASLPPTSSNDRRPDTTNQRDGLVPPMMRDVLRDGVITGGQRAIRDPGAIIAGQKAELVRGLEQNLVAPGTRVEMLKESLAMANPQRGDGVLRPGDPAGLNVTGRIDPGKSADIQPLTGAQRLDGKTGDLTGALKGDSAKGLEPGNLPGTGKGHDTIPGKPSQHTDIVGQKDGATPGKRPEATEKIDGEKHEGTDEISDKSGGKKKPEDAPIISDVPFIAGLTLTPDKSDTKSNEADKADDKDPNAEDRERRQRYIVKKGDTLELIAAKMLRDKKLAPLIYRINRSIIPSSMQDGRPVLYLRPKLIIYLPTSLEIKEYRSSSGSATAVEFEYAKQFNTAEEELQNRFGEGWNGAKKGTRESTRELLIGLVKGAKKITEHSEPSERLPYVVQLGDTLRSVAIKHPSLKDAALWKLLAEVNDLPMGSDSMGMPFAKLVRGSTVLIPSQLDIRHFRRGMHVQPVAPITVAQTAPATLVENTIVQFEPDTRPIPDTPTQPATAISDDRDIIQKTLMTMENCVADLGDRCRLIRLHDEHDGTEVRLEFEHKDMWRPVLAYQIDRGRSYRHEFHPDGSKKTLRIDLPVTAVQELAENDISSNWRQYREMFEYKLRA